MNCCSRIRACLLAASLGVLAVGSVGAWDDEIAMPADDRWNPPAPLRIPHRVPSRGLSWSRAQYPAQYVAGNTVSNRLHGLDDRENERFLDVANRAYSREFVMGFSYTNPALARPVVDVLYCRKAETFTGLLRARGLKPHFAYQIKLRGDHAADPVAFERIGNLGRWRRLTGRSTNFTDAEVAAAPDKSLYESYILLDFFVTDANGSAEKEFYLDSTLHVLFNQPLQGLPRSADSRSVTVHFTQTDSRIYANPKPAVKPHYVFAETEAGSNGQVRPHIGEAFLPPGAYRAELVLTEETFHGYGYGDSGFWPTVMACDVAFEVSGPTAPSPVWPDGLPVGRPVALTDFSPRHARVLRATPSEIAASPIESPYYSTLTQTNAIPLMRGQRQIATFEVKADWIETLSVLASADRRFGTADRYQIPLGGRYGWQRVELEITFDPAIDRCYLLFYLPPYGMPLELRNLHVTSLAESNAARTVLAPHAPASP